MHLLVLSAFRPLIRRLACSMLSVSMHLLVLSAFRHIAPLSKTTGIARSQCTFWCSVLSDSSCPSMTATLTDVSMHLLVLSAFRLVLRDAAHQGFGRLNAPFGAQCFPTFDESLYVWACHGSQCTFWCSVLSDPYPPLPYATPPAVSMHLLVLSAFRRSKRGKIGAYGTGLNAPFGAQCFPTALSDSEGAASQVSQCTFWCSVLSDTHSSSRKDHRKAVSMHLLVLSAFRHDDTQGTDYPVEESQCTFWCSVLSDLIWLDIL